VIASKNEGYDMRKLWLSAGGVVAFLGASSAAFGADLRMPLPPPQPMIYNWTGFYIGGNIGGGWANGSITDNFTGVSFGAHRSGVIGGGTGGYNWQVSPNFVVGIEGTFDGASLGTNTSNAVLTRFGTLQGSVGTDWVSTLAARFGFATNNWLFYGKAGGGWADNTVSITNLTTGGSVSASNSNGGWLVGGGIEYGITPNWTWKLEYDYLAHSHWTAATPFIAGDTFTAERNINMFTFGVNYKF
jgi:outer membrane immunogenic protein